MVITSIPGFQDRVHDAQSTFRTLLTALAHPGQIEAIAVTITPPEGITPALAAACLTLLDLETRVWLQPGLAAAVAPWLLFHTGCRVTPHPHQADFAVIWNSFEMPDLTTFQWGTAEAPETSTTLFIQTPQLSEGQAVVLSGPGILHERAIAPQLPASFWPQWHANHRAYPLGVDVFLFAQHHVMGLPRTANLVRS